MKEQSGYLEQMNNYLSKVKEAVKPFEGTMNSPGDSGLTPEYLSWIKEAQLVFEEVKQLEAPNLFKPLHLKLCGAMVHFSRMSAAILKGEIDRAKKEYRRGMRDYDSTREMVKTA